MLKVTVFLIKYKLIKKKQKHFRKHTGNIYFWKHGFVEYPKIARILNSI